MHFYDPVTAEARYFVPKKDGTGTRPTAMRDARANGWVPGVTEVLKLLDKPALTEWRVRQGVLAVCTAPDVPGEGLDAKITRVLETERQQDEESRIARDRGTEIHAAMEAYFQGQDLASEMVQWVLPAAEAICKFGKVVATEKILVGDGYAGKTDLLLDGSSCFWLMDFKTTKKLPDHKKGAWSEHKLQLSAYAAALHHTQSGREIHLANVYISTLDPGKFVICEHAEPWLLTFSQGFLPLLHHWQWANNHRPMPAFMQAGQPQPEPATA